MLANKGFIYVVDRDFGFAPNPFHGVCTLATCKPMIRQTAQVGDWVMGVGGQRLKATGRLIFAMKVTGKLSFDEYWVSAQYQTKKPVRNGSKKMLIGDNIYHRSEAGWVQADSHHSNPDGTANAHNLASDTSANSVLISEHFYYFGTSAPDVQNWLTEIRYKNGIGYRKFELAEIQAFVEWVENEYSSSLNMVIADPIDFEHNQKRFLGDKRKIS